MSNDPFEEFKNHGGPWDRGRADAYYHRPAKPHKYPNGTYKGCKIQLTDPEEIAAYIDGYNTQDDRKIY